VTLSIDCETVRGVATCPANGWILGAVAVEFAPGESVFELLKRETRAHGIHMAFRNSVIYNSAYVEAIHNLYEFDGGSESGWMYSVNGWFPNYGASQYKLKDGDVIKWRYTRALGRDIGGSGALG
jgi:hypothetical protein